MPHRQNQSDRNTTVRSGLQKRPTPEERSTDASGTPLGKSVSLKVWANEHERSPLYRVAYTGFTFGSGHIGNRDPKTGKLLPQKTGELSDVALPLDDSGAVETRAVSAAPAQPQEVSQPASPAVTSSRNSEEEVEVKVSPAPAAVVARVDSFVKRLQAQEEQREKKAGEPCSCALL